MSKKRLEPLNDFIALELKEGERTINGIYIPNSDETGVIAEVIAVGEGTYNFHSDRIIPHKVKVGDVVIMPKIGVQKVEVEGKEYYLCQANQLLSKITETN